MIRFNYADRLVEFPILANSMFCDRAAQFAGRTGWDVQVNPLRQERDQYDAQNPLCVIWQMPDGRHGGSMRFLSATGPTMAMDHFCI